MARGSILMTGTLAMFSFPIAIVHEVWRHTATKKPATPPPVPIKKTPPPVPKKFIVGPLKMENNELNPQEMPILPISYEVHYNY